MEIECVKFIIIIIVMIVVVTMLATKDTPDVGVVILKIL